jgi:hypothetical protein
MASKLAIALVRQDALARLEAAMATLAERLNVARPELPRTGRDDGLLQAQQLEQIAAWAEGLVAAIVPSGYEAMTVKDLTALASERGVDLGDARRKAEIIAVLQGEGV